jgi:hypothetical protein
MIPHSGFRRFSQHDAAQRVQARSREHLPFAERRSRCVGLSDELRSHDALVHSEAKRAPRTAEPIVSGTCVTPLTRADVLPAPRGRPTLSSFVAKEPRSSRRGAAHPRGLPPRSVERREPTLPRSAGSRNQPAERMPRRGDATEPGSRELHVAVRRYVSSWHDADHRNGAKHVRFAPRVQTSTCSAIASASSTSIPRYRTVLSIFRCPSSNWTARRLPVRR